MLLVDVDEDFYKILRKVSRARNISIEATLAALARERLASVCLDCGGMGYKEPTTIEVCPTCKGDGKNRSVEP